MEPLLRFENVSKHYPNGVHALKGVSFEMAEGQPARPLQSPEDQ